jgi:hypothetical protein
MVDNERRRFVCACVNVYMYICKIVASAWSTSNAACVSTCLFVCMYVCMYVCIYIYICKHYVGDKELRWCVCVCVRALSVYVYNV